MNMMERLAAARAKINEMKSAEPTLPAGWVHLGERNGKPHYRTTPAIAVPKPRHNPVRKLEAYKRLDLNTLVLTPGMTCPACLGSGMRVWGTCYWCNVPSTKGPGKGVLDARDIAFIEARRRGAGPICDVQVA